MEKKFKQNQKIRKPIKLKNMICLQKIPDESIFYICIDSFGKNSCCNCTGRVISASLAEEVMFLNFEELANHIKKMRGCQMRESICMENDYRKESFEVQKPKEMFIIKVLYQSNGEIQGSISGTKIKEKWCFKNKKQLQKILFRT